MRMPCVSNTWAVVVPDKRLELSVLAKQWERRGIQGAGRLGYEWGRGLGAEGGDHNGRHARAGTDRESRGHSATIHCHWDVIVHFSGCTTSLHCTEQIVPQHVEKKKR